MNQAGFMDPQLNPADVAVESTDYPRTILSAVSQLHGMYPPDTWPAGAAPLPVHVRPRSVDEALLATARCVRICVVRCQPWRW